MSDTSTKRLIDAYVQMGQPTMFFTGMFEAPPKNFYASEKIEIDIVRSDEDVSIVIQDLSVGYRNNSEDIYTNKEFLAPIHKESIALNSHDLIKRVAGQTPFDDPVFRANMITRIFNGMTKIERKILRSIELQASQVLQTGIVTLTDSNGVALYTLDYKPKTSHFPTVSVDWGTGSEDQAADLNSLAEAIRDDGLSDPDQIIMGANAFEFFIKDTKNQARFDNRRFELGSIAPMTSTGNGGNRRGVVEIGNYRYDLWSYGGRYKHPQTGVKTQFMDPDKVIIRSSSGRMDATFGMIPNIGLMLGANGPQLLPELPGRISNVDGRVDLFTNAWLTADGEQLFAGVGARPLMIPTAIDTFGCLDTKI